MSYSKLDAKYIIYRLSPTGKETGIKRFADDKTAQDERIRMRLAIVKEKGFYAGCQVCWKKKISVICTLKKISKDGLLVFPFSDNRGHPNDWDVLVE